MRPSDFEKKKCEKSHLLFPRFFFIFPRYYWRDFTHLITSVNEPINVLWRTKKIIDLIHYFTTKQWSKRSYVLTKKTWTAHFTTSGTDVFCGLSPKIRSQLECPFFPRQRTRKKWIKKETFLNIPVTLIFSLAKGVKMLLFNSVCCQLYCVNKLAKTMAKSYEYVLGIKDRSSPELMESVSFWSPGCLFWARLWKKKFHCVNHELNESSIIREKCAAASAGDKSGNKDFCT